MVRPTDTAGSILVSLTALVSVAQADGIGLLGLGKWLYKPVCAHSCRLVIRDCPILCDDDGYGSSSVHNDHGESLKARAHNHAMDPTAECWLVDASFLRTMALCMDEYCTREGVSVAEMEEYWRGHLATGTLSDLSEEMKPIMTYQEALWLAHEDVDEVGSENVPFAVSAEPLNQTSYVSEDDYIPTVNYQRGFQNGEFDHGRNSLAIAITSVMIPVAVSMTRFLPGYPLWASRLNAILDQPLFGSRHRVPLSGKIGLMPTRGQSLFIGYLIIINVVLVALPLKTILPSSRAETAYDNEIMVVGDRAGVIAFCLYVSLFLFSSRNNILIWVTGWSHGTYLLLHRWVAYICVFQTVLHSVLLLHKYRIDGAYTAESVLPYWYWGIIATLATCLLVPLSVLPIRQKAYEIFLATHQVLAALTLIGAFLHIWYLFEYDWGYEIWIYVGGAIWGLDRLVRVLRMVSNGVRTATITTVADDSDLMRVEIDGVAADGHIYLYFPSLSWRFWESHPFSVLSSFASGSIAPEHVLNSTNSASDIENTAPENEKSLSQPSKAIATNGTATPPVTMGSNPRTTLLVRPQTGTTSLLLARARASGGTLRIPVVIESSYHANPAVNRLSHCSTLVLIAGGVGITAVLPLAKSFGGVRTRMWWGMRRDDILRAVEPELKTLGPGVSLETSIGERLSVSDILQNELARENDKGTVGVVVCGPASMADDVRKAVGEVAGSGRARRGVVFVDEAFSW